MNEFFQELESLIKCYYKVDLKKKDRKRQYVDSRMIFSKIAYDFLKVKSKVMISRYLNHDHGTTLNALNNFDGIYKTDKIFKDNYDNILQTYKKMCPEIVMLNEEIKVLRLKYHEKMVQKIEEELSLKTA